MPVARAILMRGWYSSGVALMRATHSLGLSAWRSTFPGRGVFTPTLNRFLTGCMKMKRNKWQKH
jgi:hypothetical protein